ncbi:hypothetical protein KU306_17380 (plasmid) [Haloferax larsenii]|uniref:Small CPxCG-related zinc finger protein n=2 Tax=Haloferax larsenii TaxID=302484 RepID=A0ABY5RJ51_HALLR|nr:hypothetical protein C455_06166 [Haloferax larsenii JCM 13917]UVE52387.1 hypothetical protein KU306_17380 [Haloferax larsenii]
MGVEGGNFGDDTRLVSRRGLRGGSLVTRPFTFCAALRGEDKPMKTCNSCGQYVSVDFARVFGTNNNQVFACLACSTMSEISEQGKAAGKERYSSV